jgi:TPR repeat protein
MVTEGTDRPAWCTWWTATEWVRFRRVVEQVVEQVAGRASVTVDDASGVVVAGRGTDLEYRYSLERAAHHARGKPAAEWPAIIEEAVRIGADPRALVRQLKNAHLDEVRARLKVHVFTDAWTRGLAGSVVSRPLGADLVEALMLDVPEAQSSVNVGPEEVRRWGLPVPELFAIARENLRTEPVSRSVAVPGVQLVAGAVGNGMVSYAASRLLLPDEELAAAGPYGCLVVVPNHYTLAYHPIEGPECQGHGEYIANLLTLCRLGYDKHERLSDRLYWWAAGRITEVPVSTEDGGLVVGFPLIPFDEMDGEDAREAVVREAIAPGDSDTMAYVGARLALAGRVDEARRWLGRAAVHGHLEAVCNLGALFGQIGRTGEAERYLRRAIDRGYHLALTNLGALLDNTGRTEEAESWFRRAAEHGEPQGMHMLGRVLRRTGRGDEAERWFQRAAEAGVSGAMADLGHSLVAAERHEDAEPWLRRAAELDDPEGMYRLGLLLGSTSRNAEAAEWLARAAAWQHPEAVNTAERWFRANAEAGVTEHMRRLGTLLADAGRPDEARDWYRRAAEAGHPAAMKELALLLEEAGDGADAERWYHRAIEAGHTEAMYDLGFLLKNAGRLDEAERWYRRAADAGVARAMTNLGVLLSQTGRPDEGERFARRAAELGSTTAMANLGSFRVLRAGDYRRAGDDPAADAALAEAERWYVKAAEAGHAEALYTLGLMAAGDRPSEARRWYRQACDAGHPKALDSLAAILD